MKRFKESLKELRDFLEKWENEIKEIKEIKEPLFVTEDGVDIFEGDEFSIVDLKDYSIHPMTCNRHDGKNENYVYLSSKEAAEKWIDENKPVFSKKQIREAIGKSTFAHTHALTGQNSYYIYEEYLRKLLDL